LGIIEIENELKKLEEQANQSATAVQKIASARETLKSTGDKVTAAGEKLLPATAAVTTLGVAAVKRWLKQITVWDDYFTVDLKSGLKIEIEG
jgi:hypothetical protein